METDHPRRHDERFVSAWKSPINTRGGSGDVRRRRRRNVPTARRERERDCRQACSENGRRPFKRPGRNDGDHQRRTTRAAAAPIPPQHDFPAVCAWELSELVAAGARTTPRSTAACSGAHASCFPWPPPQHDLGVGLRREPGAVWAIRIIWPARPGGTHRTNAAANATSVRDVRPRHSTRLMKPQPSGHPHFPSFQKGVKVNRWSRTFWSNR